MMKKILRALCGGTLLILAGCAVQPGKLQIAVPFDPATRGEPSHRVDSANSWARVYVYRAGAMARLGHNHIVLTRDIGGELWMSAEPADAAFHLALPVESLIVDPPELRAEAGEDFASQPSQEDISGTRRNMLGEQVLDAARYPTIEIWSERIRRSGDGLSADIVVAARGELNRVTVPVTIEEARSDMLIASGKFTLRQSDVGLAPFSILMGAVAVRDELEIEYSITVESVSGIEDVLGHD
jgi:hypothetical protein